MRQANTDSGQDRAAPTPAAARGSARAQSRPLPALFVAHGAPSLALGGSAYSQFLSEELPAKIERPRAIAVFTAHWESPTQQIGMSERYGTIHDFSGFSEELYRMSYPAPGDPALSQDIADAFSASGIPSVFDTGRGLDHGVWAVLQRMYPEAGIPVVPLSVSPFLAPAQQYRIGSALEKLREDGVLILGSGGTVHNLREIQWTAKEPSPWAAEFDNWILSRLSRWDTESLFRYSELAPHAKRAVPRPEHLAPLFLSMGAVDLGRNAVRLACEYEFGSLSLSAYAFS